RAIDNFVNEYFSDIFDYNFTRKLEGDMKKIENGELNWYEVVDRVYKAFAPKLKQFPTWTTKENAESNPARKPKREIGTYHDKNVYAYLGKFGPVLQIGEDTDQDRQHIGLPKECNIETITYSEVEYLFGFPYNLGTLTDGRQVLLKKSKHGLYLDCSSSPTPHTTSKSKASTIKESEVKKTYQVTEDMFETYEPNSPMESQIKGIKFELVKNHIQQADAPKEYLRQIDDIKIIKGKYGPYFIFNGKLVGIPKYHNVDIITYDECLQLYASKNGARSKKSPTSVSSISQDTNSISTSTNTNTKTSTSSSTSKVVVKKPIIKMKNISLAPPIKIATPSSATTTKSTTSTKSSPTISLIPNSDETKKKILFKKKI
ncbi:MAG: topoisomerase C-terminal repeat-containing protein, partial [Candidatus Paceibacterota bacterium]